MACGLCENILVKKYIGGHRVQSPVSSSLAGRFFTGKWMHHCFCRIAVTSVMNTVEAYVV